MSETLEHVDESWEGRHLVLVIKDDKLSNYELSRNLEREMRLAVDRHQASDVIIDMSRVKMITSVALLPFLGLRARLRERSGNVVLCNLSEPVAQVFTVSQLLVQGRGPGRYLAMADDVPRAAALLDTPPEE